MARRIVVHPVLLAVFPVLFLYSRNPADAGVGQVLWPMFLSLTGALLLWLVLGVLIGNVRKAAVATTLCLLFFFVYGRLHQLMQDWSLPGSAHSRLLPVMLLACGYCVYFVTIAKRNFNGTTRVLDAAAVFLVLVNLGGVALHRIGQPVAPAHAESAVITRSAAGSRADHAPDIYYIILDEFAHPDTMQRDYGFNGEQFTAHLKALGFFIASRSRTRTPSTVRSIATSLGMEVVPEEEPEDLAWARIRKNRVTSFLRSRGYTAIYVGSWFDAGRYRATADVYYNLYSSVAGGTASGAFPYAFWHTTMLTAFYDRLIRSPFESYYRGGLIRTLDCLKHLPDVPGPKFVFAHVLCPHEPFVFGAGGEAVGPANWSNYRDKRYYRDQYIFISGQISQLVDWLLRTSTSPPVVVLQSDHGIRPHHPGIEVGGDEWRKILNAYYMPGAEGVIPDDVSPVDSFRLIFDHYFGPGYVPDH